MSDSNKISVQIDGRTLTLVGDYDEKYMSDIAYHANKIINELRSKNQRLDSLMAATLATINVTEELLSANEKIRALEDETPEKSEQYIELNKKYEQALAKIKILEEDNNKKADELIKTKMNTEELYQELNMAKETIKQLQTKKTESGSSRSGANNNFNNGKRN